MLKQFISKTQTVTFWTCIVSLLSIMLITRYFVVNAGFQSLIYTFCILYIGCHLSLEQKMVDPETGEKLVSVESVSQRDAYLTWMVASAMLLMIYISFKLFSAETVNMIINVYVTFYAVYAVGSVSDFLLSHVIPKKYNLTLFSHDFTECRFLSFLGKIYITSNGILCTLIGSLVAWKWFSTHDFTLHNLIATCLCLQTLRIVSLGTVTIASTLLGTLFFYDIFWVFATDVMITVAKSFEAPAVFIFPYSLEPFEKSILGLGDVVLPGFFISLLLRLDYTMYEQSVKKTNEHVHRSFPKVYFLSNMFAYQIGLIITNFVVHYYKRGQPALLYLVPACFLGLLIPAVYRHEIRQILDYSEEINLKTD